MDVYFKQFEGSEDILDELSDLLEVNQAMLDPLLEDRDLDLPEDEAITLHSIFSFILRSFMSYLY